MYQQLAVDVEAAVVGLPDDGDAMPLSFTEGRGNAASEGGKAAAMELKVSVLDVNGNFVKAIR